MADKPVFRLTGGKMPRIPPGVGAFEVIFRKREFQPHRYPAHRIYSLSWNHNALLADDIIAVRWLP